MERKARLKDIALDYETGRTRLTFEVECKPVEAQNLMGKELRLKAVQWRERRSLDANAYYHVLLSQLAAKLDTTHDELHEQYIRRCAFPDRLSDGSAITVTLASFVPIETMGGYWMRIRESKDGKFIAYMKLKGSSDMDSAEMSKLIDEVVEDCKENGIDTATPDEQERMIQQWQKVG